MGGTLTMNVTAEMLVEKAKENGKELTLEQAQAMMLEKLGDEELDEVAGGDKKAYGSCPKSPTKYHIMKKTGKTSPGEYLGDLWPDVEYGCIYCDKRVWHKY